METFTMTKKEVDQVAIFEALKVKTMKQTKAAELLKLSLRQVKRKLKIYRREGAASLAHGLRGKTGNHCLSEALRDQAIHLVEQKYPDFSPTFAAEKLEENENLRINRETLRQLMISKGLWVAKKVRVETHQWRERRACLGELVQLDGSDHDWFEGRGPRCTLLAFIDDATSQVLYATFVSSESTENLMQATWDYLTCYGRPIAIYSDRGGVFSVNLNNEEKDKLTQYGRALTELGVEHIKALSPQAKGRVERLFGTFQDRLVKELRLASIATMEAANEFLKSYLPIHNQKFAVQAKEETNLHRSINGYDLREILTTKEERSLNQDFTLRYQNQWYQLETKQKTIIRPKDKITVATYLDGSHSFSIRAIKLTVKPIPKPVKKEKEIISKPINITRPAANHPWRQYKQKVTF